MLNVGAHLPNNAYCAEWWRDVAKAVRRLRAARPGAVVLWTELSTPRGGKRGFHLCAPKVPACIETHATAAPAIRAALRAAGAEFLPLGPVAQHCSYVDWLHPSATCFYLMAQGLAAGLAAAWKLDGTGIPSPTRHTTAARGTHFPFEQWLEGRQRPVAERRPGGWWAQPARPAERPP